jgi:hypothetical protein
VVFAATDNFGMQDTNSVSIRVLRNFPPTVDCPLLPQTVLATGTNTPATVNVTVADQDGDALTVNWFVDTVPERTDNVPASPTPTILTLTRSYTLGSHTIRVDVRDPLGLLDTCSAVVNVVDGAGPVVTVSSETVEATGPGGAIVHYTATAVDAVDGPRPVTCSQASGTMFPLGSTTVTCTATDLSNNTGSGSGVMTVLDRTPPTITVSDETVEAIGPDGAPVNYTVTASDTVDTSLTIVCTKASGSLFPLGPTVVRCTATDDSDNSAFDDGTMTVVDTRAPTITVSDGSAEALGPDGAPVSYTVTASDIVDTSLTITCSAASGSVFALGATTVTCTATDDSNNSASDTGTMTVADTTPPTVQQHPDITVTAQSSTGAVVHFTVTASDNPPVDLNPAVTCTPASGTHFAVGSTQVTCTARDFSNNVSQPMTFTVHVLPLVRGDEGCTPGYWRNHLDRWLGVVPGADFDATFGVNLFTPNLTLARTIQLEGGQKNALARHATAALLNAYGGVPNSGNNETVSYFYTATEVIQMVRDAVARDTIERTKDLLAKANEAGCPLNATPARWPSGSGRK